MALVEPFLKWAGGKRWLTSRGANLFPERDAYARYFEPFVGGGAVFFHLTPNLGVLSDLNADLINAYNVVKQDWAELFRTLRQYDRQHSSEFYYQVRASRPRVPIRKAARFIYLNRTCWNGLYRVNQKGQFNVPIGTKTKVILESDNFESLSNLLQNIELNVCDFEQTIDGSNAGDFIFVDPPYTVKHNFNGFIKYNETLFSWDDQIRLKNAIVRAARRGVLILVLNADHQSIRSLYEGMGELVSLTRASVIAGNSNARGVYSEIAIKINYI